MRFAGWHNAASSYLRCVAMMLLVIATTIACSKQTRIVAMTDVNIAQWSEPATVILKNEEAKAVGELTIVLHVNRNFKAKQVELEIISMTADSLRCSEKIAITPTIKWPTPTAQSVDIAIAYRHNVQMNSVGLYRYTITPLSPLQGVESVGMSYETENQ